MQYYDKNMKLLKRNFKKTYNKIKAAEKDNLFEINQDINDEIVAEIIDKENNLIIYIEEARRSGYTMKVKDNGKKIYFHSKYDPEREAKKIVKNFGFSSKKQVFILGTGLGYYLNQFDNKNKYDKIIVIEGFLSIFYATLCYNDLSKFLSQDNLMLLIDDEEVLFKSLVATIEISLSKNIGFLEHKPSIDLFNKTYRGIYNSIKEAVNYNKIGLATDIQQAKMWRDNIINNLDLILQKPKVDDFFNGFNDYPAICVSAGPSLDKNIAELHQVNSNAIIMCVGTALNALLKNNIEPDIVVSMDGQIYNYNHFKDINEIPESILFSEMGNQYKINNMWNEKQAFFSMKRNMSGLIEKLNGNYSVINTGGTVSHSMVDIAYKMGCNPIVLVGQDLAYTSGKTHASGTTYGERSADHKKDEFIEVEGLIEDTVFTDKKFLSLLSYFNDYISDRKDRLFIDATEGGVKIKGTKGMKLKNAISEYCDDSKNNIKAELDLIFNNKVSDVGLDQIKNVLRNIINELDSAINLTKKQLKTMKKVKNIISEEKSISDSKLDELEKSFSKFDVELNSYDYVAYFVDRLNIPKRMKLQKAKSKFYINKRKSLEERLKVFYDFRVFFLNELEESLNLLSELYLNEEGEIIFIN